MLSTQDVDKLAETQADLLALARAQRSRNRRNAVIELLKEQPGHIPVRFHPLGDKIGSGAHGVIIEASQTQEVQEVQDDQDDKSRHRPKSAAIKVSQGDEQTHWLNFTRETSALAALAGHPGVVRMLDAGISPLDNSVRWIAMERLAANAACVMSWPSIQDRMAAVSVVCRDITSALSYMHRHGIAHRDIKPDNILVDFEPGRPYRISRAVLGDFGQARDMLAAGARAGHAAHTGSVGSLVYRAPEILAASMDDAVDLADYDLDNIPYMVEEALEAEWYDDDDDNNNDSEEVDGRQKDLRRDQLRAEALQQRLDAMAGRQLAKVLLSGEPDPPSFIVDSSSSSSSSKSRGAPRFSAAKPRRSIFYGCKADVWAFGVTMLDMLYGTQVFGADDVSIVLGMIDRLVNTKMTLTDAWHVAGRLMDQREARLACVAVVPSDPCGLVKGSEVLSMVPDVSSALGRAASDGLHTNVVCALLDRTIAGLQALERNDKSLSATARIALSRVIAACLTTNRRNRPSSSTLLVKGAFFSLCKPSPMMALRRRLPCLVPVSAKAREAFRRTREVFMRCLAVIHSVDVALDERLDQTAWRMVTNWCGKTGVAVPPVVVMVVCTFLAHNLLDMCLLAYDDINDVFEARASKFAQAASVVGRAEFDQAYGHFAQADNPRLVVVSVMSTLDFDLLAYVRPSEHVAETPAHIAAAGWHLSKP
ncbi:Protein kinase [Mollivirus sibericum]|uniref:Protein kinase n=1 Tax=Mollivirus sibericum TaxID=1678078 RepID=UPI0006B2E44F|nr:Protein kinase [Mollivirus sibericum]ALD62080.1 Protein kinase [Mollivirus sibericum]